MRAAVLLDTAVPQLQAGTASRVAQDHEKSSYFGGRNMADGKIDWSKSASDIVNLVRAVTRPYPGAFSHLGSRKVLFWSAEAGPTNATSAVPGTVLSAAPLTIACGDGSLIVNSAQTDGGISG